MLRKFEAVRTLCTQLLKNETDEDQSGTCLGVIESGAPSSSEVLFKVPICEIQGTLAQFSAQFVREQASDHRLITAVPPAILETRGL